MPDIVKSSKSRSTKEYRSVTSAYIRSEGFKAFPCTRCVDRGLSDCFVIQGVERCHACFFIGRSCDCSRIPMSSRGSCLRLFVVFPCSSVFLVTKVQSELERLEQEEDSAEALLVETLARISRLRKQQKLLRTKGVEMVKKNLSSMEELEEEERREAEETARSEELRRVQEKEAEALLQMQQACSSEVTDWSGFQMDDASFADLISGVAQGDFGGTPSANAERPSGA